MSDYKSTYKSEQIQQRLEQGYYDDIIQAGIEGGVFTSDTQPDKQGLDLKLASLFETAKQGQLPVVFSYTGQNFHVSDDVLASFFESHARELFDGMNSYNAGIIRLRLNEQDPDYKDFIICKNRFGWTSGIEDYFTIYDMSGLDSFDATNYVNEGYIRYYAFSASYMPDEGKFQISVPVRIVLIPTGEKPIGQVVDIGVFSSRGDTLEDISDGIKNNDQLINGLFNMNGNLGKLQMGPCLALTNGDSSAYYQFLVTKLIYKTSGIIENETEYTNSSTGVYRIYKLESPESDYDVFIEIKSILDYETHKAGPGDVTVAFSLKQERGLPSITIAQTIDKDYLEIIIDNFGTIFKALGDEHDSDINIVSNMGYASYRMSYIAASWSGIKNQGNYKVSLIGSSYLKVEDGYANFDELYIQTTNSPKDSNPEFSFVRVKHTTTVEEVFPTGS